MKCLNNEKREELGWKSPFEVNFGRKHNELVKCARQDGYTNQEEIRNVAPLSDRELKQFESRVFKLRKNVDRAYRVIAKKNRMCSNYVIDKNVFIRHVKCVKKCPRRHNVLVRKIVKIDKERNSYKVEVTFPGTNKLTSLCFSVD